MATWPNGAIVAEAGCTLSVPARLAAPPTASFETPVESAWISSVPALAWV
jgi:hypothetical protein